MGASLNLHRLFYTREGYLQALNVAGKDEADLSFAREKIRATLREAFREPERFISKAELFAGSVATSTAEAKLPTPKFRLQGSFAYHTANDCQQTPPQQVDQDDGMFIPVPYHEVNGVPRPWLTTKAYFAIVEAALKPLCEHYGWILNPGGPTDTCVRIGISSRLHIDLPLYAVSNETFEAIAEANTRGLAKADSLTADAAREDEELPEDIYQALDESEFVLAHREKGWTGSDPRKLEIWFENAVRAYGQIVRRLARDYKGLRDAHWSKSDLGSICIMAAVVKAVTKLHPLHQNRDDLALIAVGREMVKIFGGPVENPAFPGDPDKYLCQKWSPEFRAEVRRVIAEACDCMERAVFDTLHKGVAVKLARSAFGPRVPEDEQLISMVGVAAVIRQTEPAPQPKPMVPRTKSG